MPGIYPSLIAADIMNLKKEIEETEQYVHGYHIDITDPYFTSNITVGPMFIDPISRITSKQLWVHLMVERPKDYLERLPLPGGSIFTFHLESKGGVLVMIKKIKQKNWLPSLAISPDTPVQDVFPFLDKLHQVLIMTVKPGFAGQPMLTDTLSKIDPLLGYRQTRNLKFRIAVDGGVTVQNYEMLLKKGVDDFAIGSGIFKYPDTQKALRIFNGIDRFESLK